MPEITPAIEYPRSIAAAIEHTDDGETIVYDSFGTHRPTGDVACNFTLTGWEANKGIIGQWRLSQFNNEVAIFVNNSPLTPKCKEGILACNARLNLAPLPEGAVFLSASFDSPRVLAGSEIRNQVNYSLLSTVGGSFLLDYGYYLSPQEDSHPELEGMGWRALVVIGARNLFNPNAPRQILYEEAVYEQNGPQPDFEAGFAAIVASRRH